MKKLLFTIVFLMGFSGVFAQDETEKTVIEPAEYKEQIQKEGVQLIDVRTPEEFSEGHIEGAENIDFKSSGFLSHMGQFNRNQPLYIYCRSGKRSGKAAELLAEIGFQVIDLEGGYLSWEEFVKE